MASTLHCLGGPGRGRKDHMSKDFDYGFCRVKLSSYFWHSDIECMYVGCQSVYIMHITSMKNTATWGSFCSILLVYTRVSDCLGGDRIMPQVLNGAKGIFQH